MKRVVVTGAAGFLGARLCRRLVADGYEVVGLDDLSTADGANLAELRSEPAFDLVVGDVTEPWALSGPVEKVLHLASPASPRDYQRDPVKTLRTAALGTERALAFAGTFGARLVFASTSEVYGDPAVHPQPESYWGHVNPIGPRSMYDEGKRYAEALVTAWRGQYRVDAAIARIFNSYGPGMRSDDGRLVPTFVRQALAGEPLTVNGDGRQTRSLCYVDDTVDGLLALAHGAVAGPVNIGNDDERTVCELATLIVELSGSTSVIERAGAVVDEPRRRCPDLSVATRLLGWRPNVSIEDGLMRTIDHVRQEELSCGSSG